VPYIPREVSWNTIFYTMVGNNPTLDAERYAARRILQDIADHVDANSSEISFVNDLNLIPATRRYQLHGFFAQNKNAVILTDNEVAPDSDGDGLHDDLERQLGSNISVADTDGDGLRDGIEYFKTSYDLLNYDAQCLGSIDDDDYDGLNKCEENQMLTNETLFDTDKDGIPDGLEIIYELNPNKYDRNDDNDFDDVNNFNEVVMHRNPNVPNLYDNDKDKNAFHFKIEAYTNSDNINCYHVELENIEVVRTESGMNEIQILTIQIPEDISVVGFSNEPFSEVVTPSISTIKQPGFKMGKIAAELIINEIINKNVKQSYKTITMPTELIIRDSSKKTTYQ